MANRKRKVPILFYVTEAEKNVIDERAWMSGKDSIAAYLREISTQGYILYQDSSHLKDITVQTRRIGALINQIAKRINTTGNAYKEDITEIKERVDEIWQSLKYIQSKKL